MKYMSVDLETTGLIPSIHGITEFAAVFGDSNSKEEPKAFYRWLNPEGYVWSVYCLGLHAKWIARIVDRVSKKQFRVGPENEPKICSGIQELVIDFMKWWEEVDPHGFSEYQINQRGNITGAGKNFGTFDLQFLKQANFPNFFGFRVKDWVTTYELPTDIKPPDLKTCKERAILMGCQGIIPTVAHNALEDALDVFRLIQFGTAHDDRNRQTLASDPRN